MNCKNCNNPVGWKKPENVEEDILKSGLCVKCLNKPFAITSICRLDMFDKFTPEDIAKFDDADMRELADKMAEAYTGNDTFWIDLEILGEGILEDIGEEKRDQTIAKDFTPDQV